MAGTVADSLAIQLQDVCARIATLTTELDVLTMQKAKLETAAKFVGDTKDQGTLDVLDTIAKVTA